MQVVGVAVKWTLKNIAQSSKGRTPDSESVDLGSNPSSAAKASIPKIRRGSPQTTHE
jgi:hypothetical protein